ncbi:hypothetical protein [Tsuneonella sp. SYSU-LHT278]|uniref:hypothetical protein n=1 Tax=Tsuneonella sediminis TaxID=3416089 RepID=UPI003F79EB2A
MLPHSLIESAAYASLDLTARSLLTELIYLYRGDNNGAIFLSAADAAARLGQSDKRPALRAFADLQDRGFITLAKDAHFAIKASETSRARCWRLTWLVWPECPQKAKRTSTNEWQAYQPAGKTRASRRADKRLRAQAKYRKDRASGRLPGVNFTPLEDEMPNLPAKPGVKSRPAETANDANPPYLVGVKSTPYLHDTMGRGESWWWRNDTELGIAALIAFLLAMAQSRPDLARAA